MYFKGNDEKELGKIKKEETNKIDVLQQKYVCGEQDVLEEMMVVAKPMVYYIINRYYSTACHFEKVDYAQTILMEFPKWIDKFDGKGEIRFSTFLFSCIRNYYLKLLRKERTQKRDSKKPLYMEQNLYGNTEVQDFLSEDVNVENNYLAQIKTKKIYNYLYDCFPHTAQFYIAYLEGYKLPNIAKIYGVDQNQVSKEIRKIRYHLKKKL